MSTTARAPVCFTVDLEDWHQGIEIPMGRWHRYEDRLEVGLGRLLDILAEHDVRGTFFALGWIAREYPQVIREIADRGHELASHGFSHEKVYNLTPQAFREEVRSTKALVEDAGGGEVTAFRAPFFSITQESLWALDILAEEGYRVDCSISPVKTWRYGISACPDRIFRFRECGLVEFPASSLQVLGRHWGIGGAYFRIAPYRVTQTIIRRRMHQGKATMFYLHPWELDPDQPRLSIERKGRFTHYTRLATTHRHLARLLKDFRVGTVSNVLAAWTQANTIPDLPVAMLQS